VRTMVLQRPAQGLMAFTTIVVGRVGPIRIHSAISLGSRGGLPHEAPLGIMDEVSSYFRWDLPSV
jgi:hypothetical protein